MALPVFSLQSGIDEDELLRASGGSFKLGVGFVNRGGPGERYIHGFVRIGQPGDALPFHHFWLRMRKLGKRPTASTRIRMTGQGIIPRA